MHSTTPIRLIVGSPWETEQHSEYLLHGGQYASCVHAGGLSCVYLKFILNFQKRIGTNHKKSFCCKTALSTLHFFPVFLRPH